MFQLKKDIETLTAFLCIVHRSNVLNSEFVHSMRTVILKNAFLKDIYYCLIEIIKGLADMGQF